MAKKTIKTLALTGGIGSGKTTVAKMFEDLGVNVYYADKEAKKLMHSSALLKSNIIDLLGHQAYTNNQLNKVFVSNKIFNNSVLLRQVNSLIHPEVATHFRHWLSKQTSLYIVKEVAILFENTLENQFDYVLTVTAEENLRVQRVIKRDQTSEKAVKLIMASQMADSKKISNSDFVIHNTNIKETQRQVYEIHKKILKSTF